MRRALALCLLLACHKSAAVDQSSQPQSRNARRVSIEMLRRSFPVVFGNDLSGQPITWTIGGRSGFDAYSRALGEPDYADVVDENLDPSPLYLKFMDDAARDGCNKVLAADFGRSDPAQRALLRYASLTDAQPDAVNANLRYLRLRFHGLHVADSDDAPIAGLRQLLTDSMAASGGPVKDGWRAVCVALVTAPEFSLY
jgi:hypothetical protein